MTKLNYFCENWNSTLSTMKFIFSFIAIYFYVCAIPMFGQTNFRKIYETSDPVSKDASLDFNEKLTIHQAFLDKATQDQNQLNQVLGALYLFMDYIKEEEFVKAARYLLEAENIALESNNIGWQGWVYYRAGIMYVRMSQEEKAKATYEKAIQLCGEAGDSLCLGESLEQLSAMKALDGEYIEADKFFNQALPLLEKYGEEKSVATALANYGALQVQRGQPAEGIPYMERAIAMHQKGKRYRSEGKAYNNLAMAYRRLGDYDKSVELLEKAIELNQKHQFFQSMIKNYMGLFISYEGKEDYQKANEFLIKRYQLRDSLIGVETQLKIDELNKKYETERVKSELKENQIQLVASQRSIERIGVLLFFTLVLLGWGLWSWRKQTQRNAEKLAENKENLTRLTQLILEKNTLLTSLKGKLIEKNKTIENLSNEEDEIGSFYNQ